MTTFGFRFVRGAALAAAAILTTSGTAQAMTCAELGAWGSPASLQPPNTGDEDYFDIDLKAGDQLRAEMHWADNGGIVKVGFRTDQELFEPVANYDGSVGQHLTETYTISADRPGTRVFLYMGSIGSQTLDFGYHVYCTPAPPKGDVETIQNSIVRQSSLHATDMISGLVTDSMAASFAGDAKASGNLTDYSSSLFVSSPGDGTTGWAGMRYDWRLGDDGDWTGGQVAGAAGLHFSLDPSWRFGVFGAYESSAFALEGANRTAGGRGFSLGVTGAYQADDWRLELLGYGSRLGYDMDDAGTTAGFEASRLVVDGRLVGRMAIAPQVGFEPEAGLAVIRERQDAYDDSNGTAHAAETILAARGTAGGSLDFHPLGSDLALSAGAFGDYWTADDAGNGGLTGRLEVSGKATSSDALSLQVTGGSTASASNWVPRSVSGHRAGSSAGRTPVSGVMPSFATGPPLAQGGHWRF